MGRHGGGSRSGGSRSRSSSSRGGSRSGGRSGGSGVKTSTEPFYGCYNRTYYDRKGRMHKVYTNSASYGTKKGYDIGIIMVLAFITIHMLMMVGSFALTIFEFGGKVDGDASRIFIEDNSNLLDESQEKEVLKLFNRVYEKTGMPITLYTTDFSWKNNYHSIEIYSEELYYKMGMDEDAMIILFTSEDVNGFWDWEYDMYCGDDTIQCLPDDDFEKLLNNFQKSMSQEDLVYALEYSWNSIINDIGAQFKINF